MSPKPTVEDDTTAKYTDSKNESYMKYVCFVTIPLLCYTRCRGMITLLIERNKVASHLSPQPSQHSLAKYVHAVGHRLGPIHKLQGVWNGTRCDGFHRIQDHPERWGGIDDDNGLKAHRKRGEE